MMVKHPNDRATRLALTKKKNNSKKKLVSHARHKLKEEIKAQETESELKQYTLY